MLFRHLLLLIPLIVNVNSSFANVDTGTLNVNVDSCLLILIPEMLIVFCGFGPPYKTVSSVRLAANCIFAVSVTVRLQGFTLAVSF